MISGDYKYIWQASDWPDWRFDLAALAVWLLDRKDSDRFVYCDYSFISVMLPPMMLFEAPRRLP